MAIMGMDGIPDITITRMMDIVAVMTGIKIHIGCISIPTSIVLLTPSGQATEQTEPDPGQHGSRTIKEVEILFINNQAKDPLRNPTRIPSGHRKTWLTTLGRPVKQGPAKTCKNRGRSRGHRTETTGYGKITYLPVSAETFTVGPHRAGSNGYMVEQPGQKQEFNSRKVLDETLRSWVRTVPPKWDGLQEVVITAVSPENTLEEELPGECRLEVRWEAMDMGLLAAEVTGAHPEQAEGHQWLEVPEVEDLMVEVSGAVAAEVHHVSEAPRLEGQDFPERSFSLIGCPLPPPKG
jgi:hypothetical protein